MNPKDFQKKTKHYFTESLVGNVKSDTFCQQLTQNWHSHSPTQIYTLPKGAQSPNDYVNMILKK